MEGGGRSGTRRGRLARLLAERELRTLATLQLLLFWRPLFVDTAFFRDLYLLAYGVRRTTGEIIAAGELPFWHRCLHGGQPLFASPTHSVAYPTVLLQLLLPPTAAFNLEIVLHLGLCGLGAYVAARALRLSPGPALVVALAFELSGFTLGLTNLLNRLLAFPHLPIAFAAWVLYLREGRLRWFVLASVSSALMALAGFPELVLLSFASLLAWALLGPDAPARHWRNLRDWLLLGLFSAGLSAFQLVPALHVVGASSRSAGLPSIHALGWSVHPLRFFELVIPDFLGRADLVGDTMWGLGLEGGLVPYAVSLYVGFPVLLLALAGAAAGGADAPLDRRVRVFLAGSAAFAILLSLGRHLPFVPALYEAFPRLGALRFPVKAFAGAVLPISLLAGAGAASLFWTRGPGRPRILPGMSVLLGAGIVGLAGTSVRVTAALFERLFGRVPPPEAARSFSASLLHAALSLAAFGLLAIWRPDRIPGIRRAGLVALVVVDLARAGSSTFPVTDRSFFDTEPPLIATVRRVAGDGSLFRTDDSGGIGFPPESRTAAWIGRWSLATLARYTAAAYGVPVAFCSDYDGLLDRERAVLSRFVPTLPWEKRVPVLAAVGVSAVLTADPPPIPGLEPLQVVPNRSTRTYFLYRVAGAEPTGRFVRDWEPVATLGESLTWLVNGRDRERPRILGAAPATPCVRSGTASLVGRVARSETWDIDAPCVGYLVTTIPFDAGWSAEVDGRKVRVARARGIHVSVPVPAGRHRVRLSYVPPGLGTGAAVTVAALAVLSLIAARRRSGRPIPVPSDDGPDDLTSSGPGPTPRSRGGLPASRGSRCEARAG